MASILYKGKSGVVGGSGYGLPVISDDFCWYDHRSLVKTRTDQIVGLLDLTQNKNDAYTINLAALPTFVLSGVNSRSTAQYNQPNSELITPYFGVNCETSNWSIVTCCKIPSVPSGQYRGVITNRPSGVSDRWFTFGASFASLNVVQVESRHSTNGVTNQNSSYTPNNTFSIYSIIKTTTSIDIYRNGSSILSANINIGGGTDANRPWRIGTWFQDNQALGGEIASLCIYKKALSTAEQTEVESYLNSFYSIY